MEKWLLVVSDSEGRVFAVYAGPDGSYASQDQARSAAEELRGIGLGGRDLMWTPSPLHLVTVH